MRIYICDDEMQIVKGIVRKTRECVPGSSITEFFHAETLLEGIQAEGVDVLLLDIDMPGLSGLEVAEALKTLPYSPLLVFVTSHDELVYDSLQFHPFGFVRKSHLDKELPKILKDCERELVGKRAVYHFKSGEGEVYLPLSEIMYFESEANYLVVFTRKESYRFRETLSAVEKELAGQGFVRVHKGFLVNMAAVKLLGTGQLTLENGCIIPIGRSYGEETKKQIMRYMLR
ncbi:MAG: response regulator transcription factor [Lachnospiraceae bacterium]|nr:response regulator transcription factor [Lachnospiraceae bacterium]